MNIRIRLLLGVVVMLLSIINIHAADNYKETPEYLALRDSVHHAFTMATVHDSFVTSRYYRIICLTRTTCMPIIRSVATR